MIRHRIVSRPAPSTRAASSSSLGIVSMYWRSRKIPSALTRNGRKTEARVSTSPSSRIAMKTGMIVICCGIIRPARKRMKSGSRPLNSIRAKA